MVSAAALGLGVVVAYGALAAAGVGVLPSAVNPLQVPGTVSQWVDRVVLQRPERPELTLSPGNSGVASSDGGAVRIDLGRLAGAATIANAFELRNTAQRPQRVTLEVLDAPALHASFSGTGGSSAMLAAGRSATVSLSTDPRAAGRIGGTLRVSCGDGRHVDLPLAGAQAPLAAPAAAASPAAGGRVKLSWHASPSKGVGGYAVFRRPSGTAGAWTRVAAHDPREAAADRPGTGRFSYEIRPIAAGVTPELLGPAVQVHVRADGTAPAAPGAVALPEVSAANAAQVPVSLRLPASSRRGDRITITLSDGTNQVSADVPGGHRIARATLDASGLADGPLRATVALADPLGNVRRVVEPTAKDTVAPAVPARVRVVGGRVVNAASAGRVRVDMSAPAGATALGVRVTAAGRSVEATGAAALGAVSIDTSTLPDGTLHVSTWSLDAAGNTSALRPAGTISKDTVAPAAPRQFGVRSGVNNAFDTVNEYNLGSATLAAWFPRALERGDKVTFDVAGKRRTAMVAGGVATVSGLRLGSVRDGRLPLAGTVTDAAGNVTRFGAAVTKDTSRPVQPRAAWLVPSPRAVGAHGRCVAVRVAFDRPAEPGDRITVKLRSERDHELMVSAAVPGGARVLDVACLREWKLPAGRVRILGITKDPAGNRRFWKGGYGFNPAR